MVFSITKTILNLELKKKNNYQPPFLSTVNEGTLLADAEEIFFSIENWILCIKLVNMSKDRSLLVSSHIYKLQEM